MSSGDGESREDCEGAHVNFSSAFPARLVETETYYINYTSYVPLARHPIDAIPHANIHSCLRVVGFCTPFVANTAGRATNSEALESEFDAEQRAHFTSSISLDRGEYTIIAHVRWMDTDGLQHDMARAKIRNVEAQCAEGFFFNDTLSECSKCPHDTYKSVEGAAFELCEPCPEGSFTAAAGTDALEFCLDVPAEDMQYLPAGLVALGAALFCVNALLALVLALWLAVHRRARAVRNAQPAFLHLLLLGAVIASAAIPLFGVDDGNASMEAASAACAAVPWLLSIGACLAFSALFAKLERVKRIFLNARLSSVRSTATGMLWRIVCLLLLHCAILTAWTVVDPMQFERTVNDVDLYGYPTASSGFCSSSSAVAFAVPLVALHLAIILWGSLIAYGARDAPNEYQDSRHVGLAMFTGLQILAIGIPLTFLATDNVVAAFCARVGVVFLSAFTMMFLVFAPKLHAYHVGSRDTKSASVTTVRVQSAVHKSVCEVNTAAGTQPNLSKCAMEMEREELAEENESLRARMATLRDELDDLKVVLQSYTAEPEARHSRTRWSGRGWSGGGSGRLSSPTQHTPAST